jgi:hypothetical protein
MLQKLSVTFQSKLEYASLRLNGSVLKSDHIQPTARHDEMHLKTKKKYLPCAGRQVGISSGSLVGVILGYLYPHPEYRAHASSALHKQSRTRS